MAYIPPTTTCDSCGTRLPLCQRPQCGKPIPRNQHESAASWGKREFCSTECANAVRQLRIHGEWTAAVKPCGRPGCTEECVQRKNESPASFEARKFHDRECASIARRHGLFSDREMRVKKREERAKNPPKPKVKEPVERKPLIRPHTPPVAPPEPAPEVWRPAAWRALENSR